MKDRQSASVDLGKLVITPNGAFDGRPHLCDDTCAGLHSYVADGRRVCWRPGAAGRFAIDAEIRDQPIPEMLGRHFNLTRSPNGEDFWRDWTRSEALAKLTSTPIIVWLRTAGFCLSLIHI